MQNGTSKDTAENPAPSISADFLTGSTEIGLDRIRTRLLDLTNRNKLLNFRHNASSLRVVDVPINPVFGRLRENEKLTFLPVPEPGIHRVEVVSAKEYADELGWDTSYDLRAVLAGPALPGIARHREPKDFSGGEDGD
jgi:hypothetical protein